MCTTADMTKKRCLINTLLKMTPSCRHQSYWVILWSIWAIILTKIGKWPTVMADWTLLKTTLKSVISSGSGRRYLPDLFSEGTSVSHFHCTKLFSMYNKKLCFFDVFWMAGRVNIFLQLVCGICTKFGKVPLNTARVSEFELGQIQCISTYFNQLFEKDMHFT